MACRYKSRQSDFLTSHIYYLYELIFKYMFINIFITIKCQI